MDMHISQLFQPGYNSIVWPRLKDPVPTSGAYLPLRRGELCDASIHHHVQLIPVAVAGNCAAICAGKTALDSSCTFERQHLGGYLITPLESLVEQLQTFVVQRAWASCNPRPIDVDGAS